MYIAWLSSARRRKPPRGPARLWLEADNYLTIPKGTGYRGDDFKEKAQRWATHPDVLQRYRPFIGNAYIVSENVLKETGGSYLVTAYGFAALLAQLNLSFMTPGRIKAEFRLLQPVSADPPAAGRSQNAPRKEKSERKRKRPVKVDEKEEDGKDAAKHNVRKRNRVEKDDMEDDEKSAMMATLEGTVVVEKPNLRFDQVAGMEAAKEALSEAVILPMRFPYLFTGERKPWNAILLYGPPGTGKSYLAKAAAAESNCTFFSVSGSDLLSKYIGESEKTMSCLFQLARKRRPAIIFIDEIDSVGSARGSGEQQNGCAITTELLVQMNGVKYDNTGVLVLAATNLPQMLDPAVRRRFERRIEITLPDAGTRAEAVKLHMGATPHNLTEQQFHDIARRAEGFSGADINILVRNAVYQPLRALQTATYFKKMKGAHPNNSSKVTYLTPCAPTDPDPTKRQMVLREINHPMLVMPAVVNFTDFETAFNKARPSVSQDEIGQIKAFTKQFGQECM